MRLLLLAPVLLLGLPSCSDEGCTEEGCADLATVVFTPAEGDGARTLTVAYGEVEETCSFPAGDAAAVPCGATTTLTRVGDRVEVTAQAAPAEIVLVVRESDGVERQRITARLDYVDVRPNGPDCPPVCRQATRVVD